MGDKPRQQTSQAASPQAQPARHLSWSSVAKSLLAGGVAGGVYVLKLLLGVLGLNGSELEHAPKSSFGCFERLLGNS